MQASTGWGGSTGAKPRPQRQRDRQLKQWYPHGVSHEAPAPAPRPASNNGNARTQWGAALNFNQPHDQPQKYWQPPAAQQGGVDEHSGEGPDSMWTQVFQQAYRPKDARADRERAELKAKRGLEGDRHVRETELESGPIKPKVQRMTWHEYNLLTPRERAAVDFNTMLVKAVRKDIASQDEYSPGPREAKQYEGLIKNAFGSEDRASDKYFAPETMSLLKSINFHDTASDLDDFLNLRVAITDRDLENLQFPARNDTLKGALSNIATDAQSTPTEEVSQVQGQLAVNTQRLEQKLADGNKMLRSMPTLAARERNFILKKLGGTPNTGKAPLGYQTVNYVNGPNGPEPGDMNTYFIDAFDKLAGNTTDGTTKGQILGGVRETLESHGMDYEDFLNYANDRSANARQFGQQLGDVHGVKYHTAEDFRKELGFGPGVSK